MRSHSGNEVHTGVQSVQSAPAAPTTRVLKLQPLPLRSLNKAIFLAAYRRRDPLSPPLIAVHALGFRIAAGTQLLLLLLLPPTLVGLRHAKVRGRLQNKTVAVRVARDEWQRRVMRPVQGVAVQRHLDGFTEWRVTDGCILVSTQLGAQRRQRGPTAAGWQCPLPSLSAPCCGSVAHHCTRPDDPAASLHPRTES